MNKDLKNRGLNAGVIIFALIIFGVIGYSYFDAGTSIGRAPVLNKVIGTTLGIFSIVFAFKSGKWLNFIKNDRVLLWVQIIGTMVLGALAFFILATFHSGALGTAGNPL